MNRRLSILLTGAFAEVQALLLFGFRPLLLGLGASRAAVDDNRVLGLDVEGFMVKDVSHPGGWVPQAVFLALSTVLTYAVLRAAPDARPRLGSVVGLVGVTLFASGAAELLSPVMDPAQRETGLTGIAWLASQLQQPWSAPVQFGLLTMWSVIPPWVAVWTAVWILRRRPGVRELVGETDTGSGADPGPEPVPVLATARERWDAALVGLMPVVLLAVAGGPVLRHSNVRQLPLGSITFDPDLWVEYRPPPLIDEWSGVLYPALRMRPLRTENVGGWLGTLLTCLVLLAVLAVALRTVAARMAGKRPLRLLMECWCATLFAAMVAALVEIFLLNGLAPRVSPGTGHPFDAASADAIRFGMVWGWATGLAFLGAIKLLRRRGHRAEPRVDEGRLSLAE